MFPRLKRSSRDWGRYFERMMAYPTPDGPVNLLDKIVQKMKRHMEGKRLYGNVYELPIYNPVLDAEGSPIGGHCLSHLSFKVDKNHRVLLTATYRNHYYTEKLLGNIVGLGRLLQFVAEETGTTVGPLTILSTHAEIDTGGGAQDDLKNLHARCAAVLATPTKAEAA